ncbi:hypothetical protein [Bacillus sp. PK3_68]|uniref:hypothetical protein n=1 Tax=Bacillus sp. PK3_68 TaxID=2027408 RepID=UPI000E76D084|nr:hypothetical protein [Bacillus sp. PK3_68]RJS62404.1 hypothetical protein CJ483_22110 [Bacillus sp. PK3_68]
MALVVLSFYLLMFAAKKDPAIYKISARLYLLYFILYETVVRLLEKDYIEAASHFILLVGLLLQSVTKKHQRLYGQMLIVWMLLELLMLSLFDTILSLQALTFIWIGLIVFILNEKANKEERILE